MPHVEQELPTLPEHLSGIRVVLVQITCLPVFSSVLECPLRLPRKNDIGIFLTPIYFVGGSCFIDVICIYLLVSITISISDDVRVV